MRSLRLAILPLLVATSLAAQAPAPPGNPPAPAAVAPQRTAFFDIAALVNHHQRFGLEPVVLGRFALGLIGTHSSTVAPTVSPPVLANPLAGGAGPGTVICPIEGCPILNTAGSTASYDAWSLDLAVRYYPSALSFNDPRRRVMVYIGEFVGYQWRTLTEVYYPPVAVPAAGSSPAVPCPAPGCSGPFTQTQRITGWEPGAEIGVRLRPLDPLFVDVGGWFKLVTVDDPTQRLRPGQLDSRLVVAVGIGW
jgi:hypothetical protein